MIEETGSIGYGEFTEEIPVMEVKVISVSRGSVRSRSTRDEDVVSTISGAGKRRKFDSEDEENVIQLQYRSRRDGDVNFNENVASTTTTTAVSGTSDHVNSVSDLKAECVSETDMFVSGDDGFSIETSTSSIVCLESEEMESSSTSTAITIEASSRRKPVAPATAVMKMPSAAELEEFFSTAEKYEQKRFAEKYNFDIVKDVPMEGRYQWVPLKP